MAEHESGSVPQTAEITEANETKEVFFPGLEPPASEKNSSYRVLARKYRPSVFEDLIGQEAMVRTLSNAFDSGRIPQAWMLTGVRGVGKTTTARILARGLNYQKADGTGGPTIHMPEMGIHCQAILESRHIDILEMDAASHTGIDDVRQITDGVRYAPVSARYKVYIIDEVHMLSDKAFNAFLKTLEEPPSHAKFVFATTEIRKVPVTILSRCQRFDLRRVDSDKIIAHLSRICSAEHVTAEAEALSAIARASEGSVRDSLSLLDQAIAHGAGVVSAQSVRDMLGLADRGQIVHLFEALMKGDLATGFAILRAQYDAGAEPSVILSDLATFTHLVTRIKLVPETAKDPVLTEVERIQGNLFAEKLSIRVLSRAWQILLKGIPEVQFSGRPVMAAEMVLVRLTYAADLPTPDEALRLLKDGQFGTPPASSPVSQAPSSQTGPRSHLAVASAMTQPVVLAETQPQETIRLRRFEDVVALAGKKREILLKTALERDVHLVRFEEGKIEFSLEPNGSRTLANDLARALRDWTGTRWMVALSTETGQPTIKEQEQTQKQELRSSIEAHPLVASVLNRFPGAKIVDVRQRQIMSTEDSLEVDEVSPYLEPDDKEQDILDSDF